MISDQIYKGIGFFVAILVFIFVLVRIMKFQANLLEGFTDGSPSKPRDENAKDDEQMDKQVTDNYEKTNTYRQTTIDSFNVAKYKSQYDEILYNTYKSMQVKMLKCIIINSYKITSSTPDDSESQSLIKTINDMNTFLTTLNSASDVLGKMK